MTKLHGWRVLSPTGARSAQTVEARAEPSDEHFGLTKRQAEVIALITKGLSNDEIGERLHISTNTVKVAIRGAYRTMGVNSRTQALLWAIDHGLSSTHRRRTPRELGTQRLAPGVSQTS